MLVLKPGLGLSDIALSEIAAEKLTSGPLVAVVAGTTEPAVINFPGLKKPTGKAA
jgi:hypothetical protein